MNNYYNNFGNQDNNGPKLIQNFMSASNNNDFLVASSSPSFYYSNNTVSANVANEFLKCVMAYKVLFESYRGKDAGSKMLETAAYIFTQQLRIFVWHDRWLWFYKGDIYKMCNGADVMRILYELCENIACIWKGFPKDKSSINILNFKIQNMAQALDYPLDIGNYIVFKNGVYNASSCILEKSVPGKFITSMVEVDWIPDATKCPQFDSIIDTYTQGDPPLKERLLQALGLLLTNDLVKCIICFLGITNSGKSFLVSLILSLLNRESTVIVQPNNFSGRFANSMIYGKSICSCMDMDATPLNEKAVAIMKQISGGDMIGAEFKYSNGSILFRSRAHLILCSNYDITPAITDEAFEKRKLVVPFRYQLTDSVVPFDQLMYSLEPEKPAIVQKLIKAYLRLRANNYEFSGTGLWYDTYIPSQRIINGKEQSLLNFVSIFCEKTGNEADVIFAEELYQRYAEYQRNSSNQVYFFNNDNSFYKAFREFFPDIKTARKRKGTDQNPRSCYIGIRFK